MPVFSFCVRQGNKKTQSEEIKFSHKAAFHVIIKCSCRTNICVRACGEKSVCERERDSFEHVIF